MPATATSTNPTSGSRLRRLLYMCEHPPGHVGGAALIARQHLRRYDQNALHVLCDDRLHRGALSADANGLLPCRHTTVPNLERVTVRPRRFFGPAFDVINLARIPLIKHKARAIIAREGIEAIFTIPWRTDFAAAAYQLSRELGLPLFVFEMDHWHAMNQGPVVRGLTKRWHGPMLRHAHKLWVISPQMERRYRDHFGVEGEFLFHFVDPDVYAKAPPREAPEPSEFRLVYTGAVNTMFLGALESIARWLNEGMAINGRRVVLDMWAKHCPDHLLGAGVRWRGFVRSEEVPGILASADALLIAITFTDEPALQSLIRSSLYTKTVDYLASGKPVVVMSPPDTAEVDYARDVTWLVDRPDRAQFERRLTQTTEAVAAQRTQAGLDLVRAHHTAETMGEQFLSAFRVERPAPAPAPRAPVNAGA